MKIYTKKGDLGTTSLAGGTRINKDDPRVESYGTVDELGAHIAYLRDCLEKEGTCTEWCGQLETVLGELMAAAALLSMESDAPQHIKDKMPQITPAAVETLEQHIDYMSASLPEMHYFTIPGGHPMVSLAHICRTVCRRAERTCAAASRHYDIDPAVMAYINRLSDYLYILGRTMAMHFSAKEIPWRPII